MFYGSVADPEGFQEVCSMSVLIWVQTVIKGYQQTTKVAASKERVKKQSDF